MACRPACGVFYAYADGISDMQAERLIEVKNLRVTAVIRCPFLYKVLTYNSYKCNIYKSVKSQRRNRREKTSGQRRGYVLDILQYFINMGRSF